MNGYNYNGAYSGSHMDQGAQSGSGDMIMMGQDGMAGNSYGGQSLDEIVNQNAKAIRRQSLPQPFGEAQDGNSPEMRRMSMMEYGAGSTAANMGNYYSASGVMDQGNVFQRHIPPAQSQQQHSHDRRQSQRDLALNTALASSQGYNNMMPTSAYQSSPAHPHSAFDAMTMQSPYVDTGLSLHMDYNIDQNYSNAAGSELAQMHMYGQPRYNQTMMGSPAPRSGSQSTAHSAQGGSQDPGGGNMMSSQYSGHPNSAANFRNASRRQSLQVPGMSSPTHSGGVSPMSPSQYPQQDQSNYYQQQPPDAKNDTENDRGMSDQAQDYDGVNGPVPVNNSSYNPNNQGFKWEAPEGGWPSTMVGRTHMDTSRKNAYSSSGFDMLGVLMRVATRPDPEINIGSVDLSCAFVVCDCEKDDIPIVYCSDNFERLTGYTRHMILGRNCRFLQSPDGTVTSGIRRKYVDDESVLYLKNMITLRREAQVSLINYRRGGQPFMNLLTIIPVTWDDPSHVKYFVGFQVDLVEQPNAVTDKNPDGSYSINYQRAMTMPRYVMNAPDPSQRTELGQTVPRDDVSAILATFGNGESEYAKRIWDKVLLENTDDVVHVLSLKGLFQWVSPSAARVLEYEPSEIIGTALSSVCHPSDIVPVTRELKDTSSGASVNVVFRIRRKHSGYMWFEGHGSLHTEQGKGRKSIILVGRERPVYALSKQEIENAGGIGDSELWTKMSTSGMFLYVSSNVRQLLDRQPDELVGVSIQSLMRAESKTEFGRILEHARTGKKASVKHEMINRRGQILSAYTTLYPGDATEGLKPTFIVAQTRLIKLTRGAPIKRPSLYTSHERDSEDTIQSAPSAQQPVTTNQPLDAQSPTSAVSGNLYVSTDGAANTYAGEKGLVIGHQDISLASDDNLFDELKTTKSSSWQYEIRQLEKRNRMLAEEVQALIASKKKRKRRRGKDQQKDCANCHTRQTPEWRRGPSGQRDLCNSCGLRWAKVNGRVSPRTQSVHSAGASDKSAKTPTSPRDQSGPQQATKAESPNQPQTAVTVGSPKARKSSAHDKIDENMEEPD